ILKTLPPGQYDFRPDPSGRSLGELAWHLAEVDAYVSFGVATGVFPPDTKPPNIQRPMTIEALAPGYERISPTSQRASPNDGAGFRKGDEVFGWLQSNG